MLIALLAILFPAYPGAVDGIMGPQTVTALKDLQTWAGFAATGVADDTTWFIWLTPGTAQQLTVFAQRPAPTAQTRPPADPNSPPPKSPQG